MLPIRFPNGSNTVSKLGSSFRLRIELAIPSLSESITNVVPVVVSSVPGPNPTSAAIFATCVSVRFAVSPEIFTVVPSSACTCLVCVVVVVCGVEPTLESSNKPASVASSVVVAIPESKSSVLPSPIPCIF